ncbi:hypothetical protein [Chitinimonas lacunae]|uniref:Uncharacterized protein n=1 Tax=Chitinimonas lacunae TaxID=1963018 RepID=A0ABV8MK77_9NEIS
MEIDFQIRNRQQVSTGLIMELVPGLPEDDHARIESIFPYETAFGFIEPCIVKCWPAYKDYGHWGESRIPIRVWQEVSHQLSFLKEELGGVRAAR